MKIVHDIENSPSNKRVNKCKIRPKAVHEISLVLEADEVHLRN